MSNFQSEESAFNFALEYLKQISESLRMCSIYSVNEDISNWAKWLRNTYRQLSVKLKPEMDKDFLGDDTLIESERILKGEVTEKDATFKTIYFLMKPEYNKSHSKLILYLLDRLEVKIRRELQNKGMLLPNKSDPRYAILER